MKLISIILLFAALPAQATYLDLNLGSRHLLKGEESEPQNERNYGLGLSTGHLTVGFYKNSYYKTSVYLGIYKETSDEYINAGVALGVVTGYQGQVTYGSVQEGYLTPLVLPYVTVGPRKYRAKVSITPVVIAIQYQIQVGF